MNQRSTRFGFTLIELLVTIAIIGLLTAIATTSFLSAQRSSRDSARRTTLSAVASAIEQYKLDNLHYPGVATPNTSDGTLSTQCAINDTYYYNPNAVTVSNGLSTSICPSSFDPLPNWIAGLGKYLNPPAIESKYLATDGTPTGVGSFDTNGAPTASTRTYSYKRTPTGYNLYAGTEGSPCGGTYCSIIIK